jgi:hypothetical protein
MLCGRAPGSSDAEFDPSVSVGPDGRWYLALLGQIAGPTIGTPSSRTYVSTSKDGTHWSSLPVSIPDNGQDDFDTVVADPITAGRAYVTASNYPLTAPNATPQENQILISMTTDGGTTFSVPTTVHRAPSGHVDSLSRLVVLDDGSLLDVFGEGSANILVTGKGAFTLYATHSTDHGATWSRPVPAGSSSFADLVDPKTGKIYQPCCAFSLAGGPNHAAELAWTTTSNGTSGDVHIASSFDGGRSWAASADLHRSAQAFQSTVATTGATIAVTWYDFTGAQPLDQVRPTTLWLARSGDRGTTWTIEPLAGPFDLSTAVRLVGSGFLGDYQSLAPVGRGLEAAFTVARPSALKGPSDIFAAAIP